MVLKGETSSVELTTASTAAKAQSLFNKLLPCFSFTLLNVYLKSDASKHLLVVGGWSEEVAV